MRKSLFFCVTALVLPLCFCGVASAENEKTAFTPGTYEGHALSTGGDLAVSVTVSEDAIEAIEVLVCNDTDGIKDVPLERIPARIIENQSLNVDGVSGATLTSLFLKNAITDAVKQAVDSTDGLMEKVTYQADPQSDMDADIVIVGGGSAGLASAAQAGSMGLNVVLIERNGYLGGTSLTSDSAVVLSSVDYLAADQENFLQLFNEAGIEYTPVGDPAMMVSITPEEGHSRIGEGIAALKQYALDKGVTVITDTSVTGLIIEDGAVTGVTAEPAGQDSFTVNAKAVILACGGFARNKDLITEYMPQYAEVLPCNTSGSRGEAIEWLEDLDVKLVNMDGDLQWYPASEGLMAHSFGSGGGIYVDPEGNLINETNFYSDTARDAYLKLGQKTTYYQILSKDDTDASGLWEEVEHCLTAGSAFQFSSLAEVADTYNLPSFVDTMLGLGYPEESDYYVCPVRPYMYSTYGGIDIDANAHVLNENEEIIEGLYAAGEVTGSADFKANGVYMGQVGQGMQQGMIAARTAFEEIQD